MNSFVEPQSESNQAGFSGLFQVTQSSCSKLKDSHFKRLENTGIKDYKLALHLQRVSCDFHLIFIF